MIRSTAYVQNCIRAILQIVYGRDNRRPIHDAIKGERDTLDAHHQEWLGILQQVDRDSAAILQEIRTFIAARRQELNDEVWPSPPFLYYD